jgi:riboflavin kinase/FMN adenylyltransferase
MGIDEKKMKLEELGIDHLLVLPFDANLSALSAGGFVREILIDGLNTQYLVVGDDHRFGKGREGTYEYLKKLSNKYGFGLSELGTFASGETRISSTFVRSCLEAGDLTSANKLLGYDYFILGEVISGKRIGSKIGFPTANINCCDGRKQIPQDGVYVVSVQWNGHSFGGMLNIGTRPTVDDTGRKSIEVHMFGHEGDLYTEKLKVSFHRKLREEMRFNSLEELKAQLGEDKKNALSILEELDFKNKE